MHTKQATVESIEKLLRQLAATEKNASAKSEAGGYVGETSHPIKNVDDRLIPVPEGERSKENSKDVKEDQGAPSAENKPSDKSQDSLQPNIGVRQSATGEDPSIETNSAKAGKDDPGSSHPARTDNAQLDGHKYAAHVLNLTKKAEKLGMDILAEISRDVSTPKTEASTDAAEKVAGEAAAAGTEAAEAAVADADAYAEKIASEVLSSIEQTILAAEAMAVKTAQFFRDYEAGLKVAEEGEEPAEEPKEEAASEEAAEEPAPEAEGGDPMAAAGAPAGGGDEAAILQALAGGEGMGAEGAAAGMAGGAPEMGGMPGQEIDPEILMAILQQLQSSPEELEAAAVAKQAALLSKQASAKSPKSNWTPKTAAQLKQYRETLGYVRELLGK